MPLNQGFLPQVTCAGASLNQSVIIPLNILVTSTRIMSAPPSKPSVVLQAWYNNLTQEDIELEERENQQILIRNFNVLACPLCYACYRPSNRKHLKMHLIEEHEASPYITPLTIFNYMRNLPTIENLIECPACIPNEEMLIEGNEFRQHLRHVHSAIEGRLTQIEQEHAFLPQ
jgi:hypothetical protein